MKDNQKKPQGKGSGWGRGFNSFAPLLLAAIFCGVGCAGNRAVTHAPEQMSPAPLATSEMAIDLKQFLGKGSLNSAVGHSFATGCYEAYKRLCPKLGVLNGKGPYECYDEGLAVCEKDGAAFQDWIGSQKRGTH